jgi:hypothetical protein
MHVPARCAGLNVTSERNQKRNEPPKGRSAKQKTKRRLTFDLLLLHLESAALSLDRLLQADNGSALLLERPLLVRVRDTEGYQLAVEPRDISIPLLQRLLRRLASGALLLER